MATVYIIQVSATSVVLTHPWRFARDVLLGFIENQGLLLSGAVAYYTLLSIIPVFALVLLVLSGFIEMHLLLETLGGILSMTTAASSDVIVDHLQKFLQNWQVIGIVGLLLMLFFSTLAFTVLENAMSMIFFHRKHKQERHFLVSLVMPYLFIMVLTAGFLVVSLMSGWLHAHSSDSLAMLGMDIDMGQSTTTVLYLAGIAGEVLLLTSIYLVIPVGRLAWSHALVGGIAATVLWELTRHSLVWYFSTLSFVSVIYGSFASTIMILLGFEFAAIILLLGAQVIAEYERIDHGGVTPRT
ncbi:MAG: YihY/virulence factor BrkB family protein [Gammaproteobacteria bacterium]|nr:YihY/virulence factor BrkB family protein [Gammaproteobacteria bacterium]